MSHTLRQSLSALLIAVLLAPGFYFGVAPTPKAEAQMGIFGGLVGAGVAMSACKYGGILGEFGDAIGGLFDDFLGDVFGEILDLFGLGDLFGGESPMSMGDTGEYVPVFEKNPKMLFDIKTIAVTNTDLEFKECVLDPLLWFAKAILIQEITEFIVDWINEGFEGGPVFLRNPENFFRNVADLALTTFLEESGVEEYLCEPYSTDVIHLVDYVARQPSYGEMGKHSCTLDLLFPGGGTQGYTTMVEEGNVAFEGGGLLTAMQLAISGNNMYDAFFNLQSEASARVGVSQGTAAQLLDYGDGFFSTTCEWGGEVGVCTPGQYIIKQIDDWTGSALGQLEVADELSEVIQAMFSVLVQEIFSDPESSGLLRTSPETSVYDRATEGAGDGYGSGRVFWSDESAGGGEGSTGGETGTRVPSGAFNVRIHSGGDTCSQCGFVFDSIDLVITTAQGTTRVQGPRGRLVVKDDGRSVSFSADLSRFPPITSATLVMRLNSREGMANADTGSILCVSPPGTCIVPLRLGYHKHANRNVEVNVTSYARSTQ